MVKAKCKCGMKRYGYGDGVHEIWLCYKCGKFVGRAGGDKFFSFMAKEHPNVIMTLIEQKILTPIANNNHGKKPNRRTKTFGR